MDSARRKPRRKSTYRRDGVPVYSLEELLKGFTPENRHEETDWGPDVGLEIIDDDYSRGTAPLI